MIIYIIAIIIIVIVFIICYNGYNREKFFSYNTSRKPWNYNKGVSKLYGQTYFPGDSVYNTPTKYKGYPLWNRGHQFEYQNNMGNTMTNSYFLKSVINPLMYIYP